MQSRIESLRDETLLACAAARRETRRSRRRIVRPMRSATHRKGPRRVLPCLLRIHEGVPPRALAAWNFETRPLPRPFESLLDIRKVQVAPIIPPHATHQSSHNPTPYHVLYMNLNIQLIIISCFICFISLWKIMKSER